jgi:hypothetical protein
MSSGRAETFLIIVAAQMIRSSTESAPAGNRKSARLLGVPGLSSKLNAGFHFKPLIRN